MVELLDQLIPRYDTLIVAAGATHSYFVHDNWTGFAPGTRTLDDARRLQPDPLRVRDGGPGPHPGDHPHRGTAACQ
jgi:hypothetical protein